MKTMVLSQYNTPLEVHESDIPRVDSGEVLLKVRACGICQTDLKIIRGAIPPPMDHNKENTQARISGSTVDCSTAKKGPNVRGLASPTMKAPLMANQIDGQNPLDRQNFQEQSI